MQTADCRMAIEHLLMYLEQPDLYRTEANTAMSHIGGCPYCEHRVGHLVRALNTNEEDTLTCQECEELLPEYLQADRAGHASRERWPSVAQHLTTCPHCSAVYTVLSDLSAFAYREQGVEPPRYPAPDLSFLYPQKDSPPQPRPFWQLDKWGRLMIEFSAELVRTWQPPAYSGAGLKKSATSPGTLGQFSVKATEDLEVVLIAEERRNDPAHCTIVVQVNMPSRGGWPNLAGTEVTLKRNQETLTIEMTDAYGEAVFEKIAISDLAQLAFEIAPEGREL